ncbi:MAG: YfjI family protein [Phycisphaerales bacterium]
MRVQEQHPPTFHLDDFTPSAEIQLPEAFKPFPMEALPGAVGAFAVEGAASIGCDTSYIVLPMLSALASAIGNTRRVALKRAWEEPPIIWTAIVGESGTAKSPALDLALGPVRERQHRAMREHAEAQELHEAAMAEWKAQHGRKDADASSAPVPPVCRRTLTDDTTTEAIAHLLGENPRGLLVARDELAGWFGGFDRYTGGKGGDAPKWLEVFGGRALITDRRGSGTTYVPRASVCICGGIQPGILRRALGASNIENGLAARLLFAMPPRTPKRWTDDDVTEATERALDRVFDRLYALEPDYTDGEDEPRLVHLSPEAKREFRSFVNRHGEQQMQHDGAQAAAWSKLEGYGARFALVVHLTRWAAGEAVEADTIDVQSVRSAIAMVEWFGRETGRVYALLEGDDVDDARGKLVELIQRKGGDVSARELVQACWSIRKAPEAEAALNDLETVGAGQWYRVPSTSRGGRPSRRFRLAPPLQPQHLRNRPPERANGGFVDVEAQHPDTHAPFRQ